MTHRSEQGLSTSEWAPCRMLWSEGEKLLSATGKAGKIQSMKHIRAMEHEGNKETIDMRSMLGGRNISWRVSSLSADDTDTCSTYFPL